MLKEVSRNIWKSVIEQERTSVFDSLDYLELISSLHGTQLKYYIFYDGQKALLGFAVHVKGNSIVVPDHYSYSSFWCNDSLTDFSFFDTLDLALKELKKHFKIFTFRLPPEFSDVRAFTLNGCTSKVVYTYLNDTNKVVYRADIKRKLSKALINDFTVKFDDNYKEVLAQQISDFPMFGFTNFKTRFYRDYFEKLIENGYLKSFALFKGKDLIASSLVIIDDSKKKAYNLLISTSKNNYDLEASSLLYDQMMAILKLEGINVLDLYGADMKGIARFKSGFRGGLKPHYIVDYDFKSVYLNNKLRRLKDLIKKFL